MLWKYWTWYARKFGKLSSGHRAGKGQFSFQSQRKAMLRNAQTTTQLHSSHMLVKSCSKFSKLDFSSTWIRIFHKFKLDLEKEEEPEITLPTSVGSSKRQESSRKTSTGLEEAQAGIKIARRNINNLRYTDDPTLMAESREELKSLLMKVKEESEKVGLKFNIIKN